MSSYNKLYVLVKEAAALARILYATEGDESNLDELEEIYKQLENVEVDCEVLKARNL